LLEYFLGDEHSFVWLVTNTSVRTVELPPRRDIEPVARRAYAEFSTLPISALPGAHVRAAAALARIVLAPVERQLPPHVLIVADGILQYLPFAALPLSDGLPLLTQHAVVCLPSAGTLQAIREARAGRQPPSQFGTVLADPVYEPDDPRVTRHADAPHMV